MARYEMIIVNNAKLVGNGTLHTNDWGYALKMAKALSQIEGNSVYIKDTKLGTFPYKHQSKRQVAYA